MSKRLRASMRAANKGRNLRPRASQPHEPVAVPSQPPEPMEEAGSGAAVRDASADVNGELPEGTPSSDLRARETLREPSVVPVSAEASALLEPSLPPPPVEAAAEDGGFAEDTQPNAPTAVPLTKLKVASPVEPPSAPAVEPPSVPAVEPLMVSKPNTAAPMPSPPDSFKAIQPPVKEEAKPIQAKVEAPKRIEEPKKAVTVEEPKKAAPTKTEEPKKVAPIKVAAKGDGEVGSRRPASLRAVPAIDDDVDPSSVSAEFFRRDEDSVPPIEEHEEHDVAPALVLSPSTLARRARLRRLVAGVVAFAGVISIAVVGKQVSASKRPASAAPPAVVTMGESPKPLVEPQKVAATELAKAELNPKQADKVDDKRAEDSAKIEDPAKIASAQPDDAKKDEAPTAPSGADAEALKKETLSLLNRGRTKDAIAKAREAITADGTDATSYLYLGSALQDSGKWKEGIEAYCDCVRNATRGPINECRAMGGHK